MDKIPFRAVSTHITLPHTEG